MPYSDPEVAKQKGREQYLANRDVILARLRAKRKTPEFMEKRRAWMALPESKERKRIRDREFYRENRIRLREAVRKQRAATKEVRNCKIKERYDGDPNFSIACVLRTRIRQAVKSQLGRKCSKAMELLGCSAEDFRIYIESKWEPGMSWDNHGNRRGQWEIDHIMPCAIFDLTKPEHQKRCFHFSNQQPLWCVDNKKKWKHVSSNQFNLL